MIVLMLLTLVALPALIGWLLYRVHPLKSTALTSAWHAGDPIVYRVQKHSTHPGVRACQVRPSERGEEYAYLVDKFWAVKEVLPDGQIIAITRTHKQHRLRPDDRNLRKPGLIEWLRYRHRFPQFA